MKYTRETYMQLIKFNLDFNSVCQQVMAGQILAPTCTTRSGDRSLLVLVVILITIACLVHNCDSQLGSACQLRLLITFINIFRDPESL